MLVYPQRKKEASRLRWRFTVKLATSINTTLNPKQAPMANPAFCHEVLTVIDDPAEELKFDEEELVTNEGPFETLHLEQEAL